MGRCYNKCNGLVQPKEKTEVLPTIGFEQMNTKHRNSIAKISNIEFPYGIKVFKISTWFQIRGNKKKER